MIPSGDEVVLLLKRLFDERLPILVWFVSADSSVDAKISGFVNGLARDMIVFSDGDPVPTSLPSNRICVDPRSIVGMRYSEIKDADGMSPEEKSELESKYGSASLALKLSSGARLTVFELSSK
jgi:hypothetical protein